MNGEDRALKSRLLPGRPGGLEERVEREVRREQLQRVQRMSEAKIEGQKMWLPEPRGTKADFKMQIHAFQDITESKAENFKHFCVNSVDVGSAF